MSNTLTTCEFSFGPVAMARPLPPWLRPGDGVQYAYIVPLRVNRSASSVFAPVGFFLPLRSFLSDRRRIIRIIVSRLTRQANPPPALVREFLALTADVERRISESPVHSNLPVVPLVLRIRDERPGGGQAAAAQAIPSAAAQAIPSAIIEALEEAVESGEYQDRQCSICLEEFGGPITTLDVHDHDDDKKIVRTPCSHVYHKKCIVEWLKRNHLCPLCRYAMP